MLAMCTKLVYTAAVRQKITPLSIIIIINGLDSEKNCLAYEYHGNHNNGDAYKQEYS